MVAVDSKTTDLDSTSYIESKSDLFDCKYHPMRHILPKLTTDGSSIG
jgi:hypothetical protein